MTSATKRKHTPKPSSSQQVHSLPDVAQALANTGLEPLTGTLPKPAEDGRPQYDRDAITRAYVFSRLRRTAVPHNISAVHRLLDNNVEGLADLCEFTKVPSYSTLNAVFKELERHPNEKRILFHEVAKELRKQGAQPQRQRPKGKLAIIAKKKNRRVRRKLDPNGMTRNTEGHREMRLRCALGIPQLGDLIPDESAAERFIVKSRWPDGHVRCPRPDCSSDDVTEKSDDDRKTWR